MNENSSTARPEVHEPIFVELEGALIRGDLLWESIFAFVGQNVLHLCKLAVWLAGGIVPLRRRVLERVDLDVSRMPYDERLLSYLKEQKLRGRELVLTTRENSKYAEPVARHLGIFDRVLPGPGGTDLSEHTSQGGKILRPCIEAMRLHQWVKNLLVFVPLIMAHKILDPGLLVQAALAFVAFGLCASSAYVLNDLLDLAADRQHAAKRQRPIAAGELSIKHALVLLLVLLAAGVSISLLLPPLVTVFVGFYYFVTLAYSLKLKRIPLVDVIVLALLYTLRLVTGGAATAISLSFWLMAFSMFLFLSLALLKRYSELLAVNPPPGEAVAGRNYELRDMAGLAQFGSASGYISVLVLALYVNSKEISLLYSQPKLIWLLCPMLLYWVSRIWMLALRGDVHEDPIVFTLEDQPSRWLGLAAILVLWSAV